MTTKLSFLLYVELSFPKMESGEKIWKLQKLPYFFKGDISAELTSDLKVLPIN